jgi:hypothetical protein
VLLLVQASSTLAKLRKPSDPKLDYSSITIELHTLDGLVKDSTQCAPNGYYFLPVYDKGKFLVKIRGPEGWSFEPNQVSTPISLLVIVCSPRRLLLLLGVFQTPLIVDLL